MKNKLEDQLTLEVTTLDHKNEEKPRSNQLHFLPPSKILGLSSFALVTIGGVSLLGLQHMQKSYEGLNTNRAIIKLKNPSTRSPLAMGDIKSFDKTKTNIKEVQYIDPFLSTIKSSKENHYYQVKKQQIENSFSF